MGAKIEIPDRIYPDVEAISKQKGFSIDQYCVNAILRQVSLDKYGDLNEKIVLKEKAKPQKEDVKHVENVPSQEKTTQKEDDMGEIPEAQEIKEETNAVKRHRIIPVK